MLDMEESYMNLDTPAQFVCDLVFKITFYTKVEETCNKHMLIRCLIDLS